MSDQTRTFISASPSSVGQEILLQGWVDTKRDHGKVTFIDLRDHTGVVQCVGYKMMGEVTTESVVELVGLVKERPANMVNDKIVTGGIEIEVKSYTVLNKAKELPITLDSDGKDIGEEARLKYRYLDLRRPRMQQIVKLRSDYFRALRTALYEREFTEVETPMLTKSTKEGARDFIVPSRFQPGKFYALPQSPQQYKQLLMTAGVYRYFQFARCIRDEDLRADRGFEFTQLDVELSFAKQDEVMQTIEDVVKQAVKTVGGKLKDETFPVVDYADAIKKYGADRFDLRTEAEKQDGTLAFAWVVNFPFFKKVDKGDIAEVRDGKSGWTFTHNPFSAPLPEHEEWLLKGENVGEILTTQYDLVCNGYEVGGGSIRAHKPELLKATFKVMGYGDQEIEDSVGHMLEAFSVGTPPHGGLALGLDRLIMLLAGETSLKETIAFPMSSTGRTAVMDAPSPVAEEQLQELGLSIRAPQGQQTPHDFILDLLKKHHVEYQYLEHEPVTTSQEAARVRGGKEQEGAKALVMQADKEFVLYVLPGDQRADLAAFQKHLGVKKLAMASTDSVYQRTGLKVGSIPPFGSSIKMKTYVDSRLAANEQIAFNVGRHDRSVIMKYADYVAVEKPEVVNIG
ncbi:MAG TPA: amino acid--tRNA ligase-related protein [Vitreimonas sp.]|nr:amino acid--tRNA ligase-related protein [Vitreimonas sp.]